MVTIGMNPTREECLFPGGFPTKENIMTTNRRAFLQSAGALLAGAGLARSVSAMPTERPEKFDESFDVVVLGAGGAGLTAAIRLAEGGKKVLLAEKLAFCGGSSLICGGGVAVTETDMCAVDAIQALVGCTFGKGNLIFRDRGKVAFTFFRRSDGKL